MVLEKLLRVYDVGMVSRGVWLGDSRPLWTKGGM